MTTTTSSSLAGLSGTALTDAGTAAVQADNDANFARQVSMAIITNDGTSNATVAQMMSKLGDAEASISSK